MREINKEKYIEDGRRRNEVYLELAEEFSKFVDDIENCKFQCKEEAEKQWIRLIQFQKEKLFQLEQKEMPVVVGG